MIIFAVLMLHNISKAIIFASVLLNTFITGEIMKLMRQGMDVNRPVERQERDLVFCISNHFLLMLNVLLMDYFKFLCVALCAFVFSSCMDDGEGSALVKVKKDDIAFRLSLLNEQGEPANVFNEGENFIFHFEMENLRKNDKREYAAHHMGKLLYAGFCRIYDAANGDSVYSAFQNTAACAYVYMSYPFDGDSRLNISLPLHYDNEEWRYGACVFRRNPPFFLPKGDYYTGFTCTFLYSIPSGSVEIPSSEVETGPVTMKVYFTVK
jgi:hypothetical protein